jgi:hypothetical protein
MPMGRDNQTSGTQGTGWFSASANLGLAIVPLAICFLLMTLTFPRASEPSAIPLPVVDQASVRAQERADDDLSATYESQRLPQDVLALGSALRELRLADARGTTEGDLYRIRRDIDAPLGRILREGSPGSIDAVRALRARQLKTFQAELAKFEATGVPSEELEANAGGFLRTLRSVGWVDGQRVRLSPSEVRVLFKMEWNTATGLDEHPKLALTLDEKRVYFALCLRLPHPAESVRAQIDRLRRAAKDEAHCRSIEADEVRATEAWRLEKVRALALVDPSYPSVYARGIAEYRSGQFERSAQSFRDWLVANPEGRYSLRARNFLEAASRASVQGP